jgi:hypothetical protein
MFHNQEDQEAVDYWNSSNYPSIFRAPQNYPIIFSNLLDVFKLAIESYLKGFPSKALQKCPRTVQQSVDFSEIRVGSFALHTIRSDGDIIFAEANELPAF